LIAVGDSAEIELILSTGRKKNLYSKSARIITSDLLNRTMSYKIKAYIVPEKSPTSPVVCMPRKLNLTTDDIGTPQNITIKNVTVDSLDLRVVLFDDDYLDVRLPKSRIGPGESIEVIVKIRKDRGTDVFDKSFTFRTGDKSGTRFTVPVKVTPAKRVGNKSGSGGG
jgi:hypothetical protein